MVNPHPPPPQEAREAGLTPGPDSPTIVKSGSDGGTMVEDTQNAIEILSERVQELVAELDRLRNQFHELERRVNRLDQPSVQLRQRL